MIVASADGGTESMRAHVYRADGTLIGNAAAPYPTQFTKGARAEQDPRDWWRALGEAMRTAVREAGIDGREVEALAIDTTSCSVVALDEAGAPLRPAIIWMDVRASEEAQAVLSTGDPALVVNNDGRGPVSAEWMIPKALWLARHEPETFRSAATICEYQDYLSLRLTGRRVASLSNLASRWHYLAADGGWPLSLLAALDLDALAAKWPQEIARAGEVIGTLTPAAAEHLSLSPRTRLVQGGVDAMIGVVGLGVHRSGEMALITGSSHLQYAIADGPLHAPGLWGSYADALYAGTHILEGGQTSTGSIIQWLGRLMGSLDLEALNAAAAELAPGSDGLLVQDHFQGNRTPHTDAHSRGALTGLTLAHGPAHVFRAIIEGVCFGTKAIVEAIEETGFRPTKATLGGGAAGSDLWLQIHADTLGMPIHVPASRAGPNVGGAVLAAVGAGLASSLDEAMALFVREGRVVEPNPEAVSAYAPLFERYKALYPALREVHR